jgi:hypothetical protein
MESSNNKSKIVSFSIVLFVAVLSSIAIFYILNDSLKASTITVSETEDDYSLPEIVDEKEIDIRW